MMAPRTGSSLPPSNEDDDDFFLRIPDLDRRLTDRTATVSSPLAAPAPSMASGARGPTAKVEPIAHPPVAARPAPVSPPAPVMSAKADVIAPRQVSTPIAEKPSQAAITAPSETPVPAAVRQHRDQDDPGNVVPAGLEASVSRMTSEVKPQTAPSASCGESHPKPVASTEVAAPVQDSIPAADTPEPFKPRLLAGLAHKGLVEKITSWPALAALGLLTAFVVGYVALSRPEPGADGNGQQTAAADGLELNIDGGDQTGSLAGGGELSGAEMLAATDSGRNGSSSTLTGPLAGGGGGNLGGPLKGGNGLPSRGSSDLSRELERGGMGGLPSLDGEVALASSVDRNPARSPASGRPGDSERSLGGGMDLSAEIDRPVINRSPSDSMKSSPGSSTSTKYPVTEPASFRYHPGVTFPATPSSADSARAATVEPRGRLAEAPGDDLTPWTRTRR